MSLVHPCCTSSFRQHLWVFVKCLIENPAFDSQTKETLTTTVSRFGSKCTLSERTINAVAKSPILEGVLLWAQTKAQVGGQWFLVLA